MTQEQLLFREWILEIKKRAFENRDEHHADSNDLFKSGANFAYYDVLTLLQQDIEGMGWDPKEMGLSENLDQEFYQKTLSPDRPTGSPRL